MKKYFYYFAIGIVFLVAIVSTFIALFCSKEHYRNIASVIRNISISLAVSLHFALNISVNRTITNNVNKEVTKISEKYKIDIEEYKKEITSIKENYEIELKQYKNEINQYKNETQVLTSMVQYAQTIIYNGKDNPDKEAMGALDVIFKPLEDLCGNDFSFEKPLEYSIISGFEEFITSFSNSTYYFKDQILSNLFIDLCSKSLNFNVYFQCYEVFDTDHGYYISTYTKYRIQNDAPIKPHSDEEINSQLDGLQEMHKAFYDVIQQYQKMKRRWTKIK